jgi:hypothetical protein
MSSMGVPHIDTSNVQQATLPPKKFNDVEAHGNWPLRRTCRKNAFGISAESLYGLLTNRNRLRRKHKGLSLHQPYQMAVQAAAWSSLTETEAIHLRPGRLVE